MENKSCNNCSHQVVCLFRGEILTKTYSLVHQMPLEIVVAADARSAAEGNRKLMTKSLLEVVGQFCRHYENKRFEEK